MFETSKQSQVCNKSQSKLPRSNPTKTNYYRILQFEKSKLMCNAIREKQTYTNCQRRRNNSLGIHGPGGK